MTRHDDLDSFLAPFDATIHGKIAALLLRDGVDGLVAFENNNFDSSQLGQRSALCYGPGCTTKALPGPTEHLHDLPSQRQYPVAYYAKPALPGPADTPAQ